jgi:hypothetical protein
LLLLVYDSLDLERNKYALFSKIGHRGGECALNRGRASDGMSLGDFSPSPMPERMLSSNAVSGGRPASPGA